MTERSDTNISQRAEDDLRDLVDQAREKAQWAEQEGLDPGYALRALSDQLESVIDKHTEGSSVEVSRSSVVPEDAPDGIPTTIFQRRFRSWNDALREADFAHDPEEEGDADQDPKGRNPCGKFHPLPCGVDRSCPVPIQYFREDRDRTNAQIWEAYQEDTDR